MAKVEATHKMIVRACVGCMLPTDAVLIGKGEYQIKLNEKNQYYDYEIDIKEFDNFVLNNQVILIENGLLKIEKSEEEKAKELEEKKKQEGQVFPGGYRKKTY